MGEEDESCVSSFSTRVKEDSYVSSFSMHEGSASYASFGPNNHSSTDIRMRTLTIVYGVSTYSLFSLQGPLSGVVLNSSESQQKRNVEQHEHGDYEIRE